MIPNTDSMDKVVERPRGLSKGAYAAIGGGGGLLLVLLLAAPAARRVSKAERTISLASVRIGAVTQGDLVRDASAQGKVVAALHPTLFAPAPGIVALKVKAGESVKKGQVLAHIESPEL